MADPFPPISLTGPNDRDELLIGIMDALFGLGVALSNAGLVTREQIAAAMVNVVQQQRTQNATPASTYAARLMAHLFSAQVITDPLKRFGVVDGGKVDEAQE